MIHLGSQIRRVEADDYYQISNLIFNEANVHRHLDWRSPLQWIGERNYWALQEHGRLVAAFACPESPPQVAWIHLFGYQPHLSPHETWSLIWRTARDEMLEASPQTQVASIVTKQWFQTLLIASGFEITQKIVLLEMIPDYNAVVKPIQDFSIRPMRVADIPAVEEIDRAAFGAFWHNTADSLQRAHSLAVRATVAENDSGLIGYQISTGSPRGMHLARLAVKPHSQGRGVGEALVRDAVQFTFAARVSVNTQDDNTASLALYKKMGFFRTGEYFPVMICPL